MREIYDKFAEWIDFQLEKNAMPESTVSFCFNLYDESRDGYGMQLVACDSFNESDEDWACCNVYIDEDSIFVIKGENDEENEWENAYAFMKGLALTYLEKGKHNDILLNKQGGGIGHVSGDLELIYIKNNS